MNSLTPDDISDAYPANHKPIILTAVANPFEENYKKLATKANEALTKHGFETRSYSTIRRVIRGVFRPNESDSDVGNPDRSEERLGDLTVKQQAIIIAFLAHPDETNRMIAARVGAAESYPAQVADRASHILDRIENTLETTDMLGAAVSSELTAADVTELAQRGFIDDVDVDLSAVSATRNTDTTTPWSHKETVSESAHETDTTSDDKRDRPVTEQDSNMSASPYSNGTENTDNSHSDTDTQTPADDTDSATSTDVSQDRHAYDGTSEQVKEIPRSEIRNLVQHIEFVLAADDSNSDPTHWQQITAHVQAELTRLLDQY